MKIRKKYKLKRFADDLRKELKDPKFKQLYKAELAKLRSAEKQAKKEI